MKMTKRLAAMAAAMVMAATMCAGGYIASAAPAAADTFSITVDENTQSKFRLYQMLTGSFGTDEGEKVILDAEAGTNLKGEVDDFIDFAKNANKGTDFTAYIDGDPVKILSADDNIATGLVPGYYLLVEEQGESTNVKNAALLKIVDDDLEVASKLGSVIFEKKVKDINDSTESDMSEWQDSADHDIGDKVPFMLKATLPENVSEYSGYFLQFSDTISPAFNVASANDIHDLKVGIDNDGDGVVDDEFHENETAGVNTGYDISVSENSFTITIPDVKYLGANNNSVIVVNYSATLGSIVDAGSTDDKVNYGKAGNPNTAKASYSNNTEFKMYGDNTPGDGDKPGTPGDEDKEDTTEDKVIVFTYKTEITKTDNNGTPLDGADFTLYKQNAGGVFEAVNTKVVEPSESDNSMNGPVFSFYGLDDGIYKLEETIEPDGYRGIDPIIFEVTAEHDKNSDDPKLEDLSAMIYDLENKKATTDEFGNVNVEDGLITSDVANTKVSKLPETGGMGTKLFVIGGGLTAGAAGIYLITKKRTKDAE